MDACKDAGWQVAVPIKCVSVVQTPRFLPQQTAWNPCDLRDPAVRMCVWMCGCMDGWMQVCMYACMRVYMHTCTFSLYVICVGMIVSVYGCMEVSMGVCGDTQLRASPWPPSA